jgi:hypothetical protein
VRENLCRAFSFGRTAKGSLPCVFSIAHGKQKTLGKKLFAVRFYISARQTNSLPFVFWVAYGKLFPPPTVTSVTLYVSFAVRY